MTNYYNNDLVLEQAVRITELEQQRDTLLAALVGIKSNLLHQRFGANDTYQAWKNAAVRAEADAEEAIASVKVLDAP